MIEDFIVVTYGPNMMGPNMAFVVEGFKLASDADVGIITIELRGVC